MQMAQDGVSNLGGNAVGNNRFGEEWEARESQRQRELEEARARASQMEKTMKWWSDCTANWREKWIKVRNERNMARDEAKQLRTNLDAAIKESNSYKREKNELEIQISQLKKEMEKIHMMLMKHAGQFDRSNLGCSLDEPDREGRPNSSPELVSSDGGLKNSEDGLVIKAAADGCESRDLDIEEYILQGAVPKHAVEMYQEKDDRSAEERRLIQQLSSEDGMQHGSSQAKSTSALQICLEETKKILQLEREEKAILHKNLERVALELQEVKDKCEELRASKQDAVRELLTLQEQHRAELRISNNALQEEINAREALERRLCELRGELERLQTENAVEWGKRERLETDKLALERENKKLRGEIRELQERVERRGRTPGSSVVNVDSDLRALQQELVEKNKEISDLKYAHSKMKKLLAESNTELGHAVRRAEQYETEVKRLRARIEELKRDLAGAEDELDAACNQVRRLQRTSDDFSGQHIDSGSVRSKSNFNDIRQIFDDTKRTKNDRHFSRSDQRHSKVGQPQSLGGHPHQSQHQSMYYDAKPSSVEGENIFERKHQSGSHQKFDFEKAKQKFDRSHKSGNSNSISASSSKAKGYGYSSSASSSKRNSNNYDLNDEKANLNDAMQYFDENLKKGKESSYMKTSLNLDGLKISDDEAQFASVD